MIPTSADGAFYMPQFVWANRCSGISPHANPHDWVCVPKEGTVQKLDKELYDNFGDVLTFTYDDHTDCKVTRCSEEVLNCKEGTK